MKLLKILIFYVVLEYHPIQNQDYNLTESYANVSTAIADNFQSGCIFVLASSGSQGKTIFLVSLLWHLETKATLYFITCNLNFSLIDQAVFFNIAKYISSIHKKLSAVETISEYFDRLNNTSDSDLCYMPLHVVIDYREDMVVRDEIALVSNCVKFLLKIGKFKAINKDPLR